MKTKRYHNTRGWGRALSALLALALAVGLVLTVPPLDGLALADEVDTPVPAAEGGDAPAEQGTIAATPEGGRSKTFVSAYCNLTLSLPNATMLGTTITEDEKTALTEAAEIDYYKIADAVPVAGYDVYDFRVDSGSPYYDVIKNYVQDISQFVIREVKGTETYFLFRYESTFDAPVDDWNNLMETVARTCFDGLASEADKANKAKEENETYESTEDYGLVDKTGRIGEPATGLEPGLYLTVLHGKDISVSIVDRAKRKEFSSYYPWYLTQQGEGEARTYSSIAFTNENIYTFQPQLIALPGSTEVTANGYGNSTTGDWNYNMTAVLKPESKPHMASLMIHKTIVGTAVTDPATFVFLVEGIGANGEKYEDLRSIEVDKDHTSPADIEIAFNGIKAGTTVKVTEKLSDASYTLSAISANAPEGTATPNVEGRSITITSIPGGDIVLTVPDPAHAGKSVEVVLQGDAVGATVTVSATNTHTNTTSGSGSVVNVFDPNEEATGWSWTKRHYEDGVWTETSGTTANTPNS